MDHGVSLFGSNPCLAEAVYTIAAKLLEKYLSNKTVSIHEAMCHFVHTKLQMTNVYRCTHFKDIRNDASISNDSVRMSMPH